MSAGPAPLVSVVMPVLAPHPEYFPQAVRSILQQTLADFELIIVEDPSPRSAAALLTGLEDPRLRHYWNPARTSLVEQRNRGLAEARAPLVAMFDGDDVADPDRLRLQVEFLNAHPEVAVLGSQVRLLDPQGNSVGYRSFPLEHDAIVSALRRWCPLCQPSVMFRKEVVLSAGGYQYRSYPVVEDYDLWSRLALAGARFANHSATLLHYRIHPGQMKQTHLRESIRGTLDIKTRYWLGEMTWSERVRTRAESLALLLPEPLVLRLFLWFYCQFAPPANGRAGGEEAQPKAREATGLAP